MHEGKLWVATFGEATKYMRERMSASVKVEKQNDKILVNLSHTLDKNHYGVPLTLKTYVNGDWKEILVKQGSKSETVSSSSDDVGTYVLYQATPNGSAVELSRELKN